MVGKSQYKSNNFSELLIIWTCGSRLDSRVRVQTSRVSWDSPQQNTISIKSWSTASARLSAWAPGLQTHAQLLELVIVKFLRVTTFAVLCKAGPLIRRPLVKRFRQESVCRQTDSRYQIHYLPALLKLHSLLAPWSCSRTMIEGFAHW